MSHYDDHLWNVKVEFIVKANNNNIICFFTTMFKLLDVLFIIKLYARVNIFRKINEQQDIVEVVTGKKRVEYTR